MFGFFSLILAGLAISKVNSFDSLRSGNPKWLPFTFIVQFWAILSNDECFSSEISFTFVFCAFFQSTFCFPSIGQSLFLWAILTNHVLMQAFDLFISALFV